MLRAAVMSEQQLWGTVRTSVWPELSLCLCVCVCVWGEEGKVGDRMTGNEKREVGLSRLYKASYAKIRHVEFTLQTGSQHKAYSKGKRL